MRLVPGPAAPRPLRADGPRSVVPPLVADRIRVLRASDRSLVLDCADEDRGARPTQDPVATVRQLALASVEVIAGSRPAAQLARWVTPGVLDALRRRADLARVAGIGRHGLAPVVRHARVCVVDQHVVEGAVVIEDGRRVRAVAVRLETHRGAWRATALVVG